MKRVKPMDKRLGKCLKRLRIEAELTQSDLAAKGKITFQQIQKYESGVNRIAVSTLFRLAPALGYTPTGFLTAFQARF